MTNKQINRLVAVYHAKMIAAELERIANAKRYDIYRVLSQYFPKRVVADAMCVCPRIIWIATVQQYCGKNIPHLSSIAVELL